MKGLARQQFDEHIGTSLRFISKQLLINSQFTKHNGLYEGKIGAALYLYHSDAVADEPLLYNLANELLLACVGKINKQQLSYQSGAAGIAWAINYLHGNDFVNIGDSAIFADIDSYITREATNLDMNQASLGITAYVLSSIRPDNAAFAADYYRELNYLLKNERIINHLDRIHLDNVLHTRLTQQGFINELEKESGVDSLISVTEQLTAIVAVVKRATANRFYPEVSGALLIKAYETVAQYVYFLFELVSNENRFLFANPGILEYLVVRQYNLYLQLATILEKHELVGEFADCMEQLHEQRRQAGGNAEGLSTPTVVNMLASLSRISLRTANERIATHLRRLVEREILQRMHDETAFMDSLVKKGILNIGVSGLAGIGLVLLSQRHPSVINWDESLLIS